LGRNDVVEERMALVAGVGIAGKVHRAAFVLLEEIV
jgi:hypothetical protein